jgi:plastocyanin
MRWLVSAVVFASALASACHLAEAVDPPRCPDKTHPENGQCAPDPVEGPVVTIASCVLTPDAIKVAPNAEFRFKNEDAVDHTITGDDGKAWVTARANQESPILGITKVGTWGYHVSDCANGGTVVVE